MSQLKANFLTLLIDHILLSCSTDFLTLLVNILMIKFCFALNAIHKGLIDPALVRKARQDEVSELHRYGVTDIVPRSQFEEHKKREALAGTRWSDTNKGTEAEPDMRSRLCARDQEAAGDWRHGDRWQCLRPLRFDALLTAYKQTFVQNWQEP